MKNASFLLHRMIDLGIIVMLWQLTVGFSIVIASLGAGADDYFLRDPAGTTILNKYRLASMFVISATLIGSASRCLVLYHFHGFFMVRQPGLIGDVCKNGIMSGGLALGTLTATIAVIQTVLLDELILVPGSETFKEIVWYAFGISFLGVLAAYTTARGQLLKRS